MRRRREPIDFGDRVTRLKSPGIVCLSALAATAKRSASSRRAAGHQPVDQPAGEAVAAADAIDEPHVVALAAMQRAGRRRPTAPRSSRCRWPRRSRAA